MPRIARDLAVKRTLLYRVMGSILAPLVVLFKYGPNTAPVYFRPFLNKMTNYNTIWLYERKKHRWCAWDLNTGSKNGRRRRIHLAMAAPEKSCSCCSRRSMEPQGVPEVSTWPNFNPWTSSKVTGQQSGTTYLREVRVLKNGPIPASFCLILSLYHYNFNTANWKKHRWFAWDLNPRQ